ncbi:ROK family protein [Lacticaseibacillus chiayiensis]|uniref:ROK family protein n=1 Tax=Lacticaseibacillus chiayiensis TaxID=2100821 RepID=UPI003C732A36
MTLALIDIGGTSIKFGLWEQNTVLHQTAIQTPKTLEEFYQVLKKQIQKFQAEADVSGVAISSPGSVDQSAGVIRGASAIPYIHNFKIVEALEKLLGLPIAIENDANCAGLAESAFGAAKDHHDSVFIVIGSGIGGAVIADGKVRHGAHLLGGEFGYMLESDHDTVSIQASPVWMANRYNQHEDPDHPVTGQMLFDNAQHDPIAKKYLHEMFYALARLIFNLQYSIDPEIFVLGGGVSNNDQLLPGIEAAMDEIMSKVKIAEVRPAIKLCQFRSEANLVGAAVNYMQTKQQGRG